MADPTADSGIWGYLASAAAGIGTVFAGLRIARAQASSAAVTEASNDANIDAIATWQTLAATLEAARVRAEERADKFQEERNAMQKELYAALGKVELLTKQIESLNSEIGLLRLEVAQLRKVAT